MTQLLNACRSTLALGLAAVLSSLIFGAASVSSYEDAALGVLLALGCVLVVVGALGLLVL